MKINVYSKPGCAPCKLTKDFFERELADEISAGKVEIVTHDITLDETALKTILDLGFQGVPVTIVEGFDPVYSFDMGMFQKIASAAKE